MRVRAIKFPKAFSVFRFAEGFVIWLLLVLLSLDEGLFLSFRAILRHMALFTAAKACSPLFVINLIGFGVSTIDSLEYWRVYVHWDCVKAWIMASP